MSERNQGYFGKFGVAACFGEIAQKTVESVLHALIDVPLLPEARSYPKYKATPAAPIRSRNADIEKSVSSFIF